MSATKFLYVKTVSDKGVRHSGLSNRAQMVGGDVPFYLKFSAKMTYPPEKQRFNTIDICS